MARQDLRVAGKAGRRRVESLVDVRERERRAVEMVQRGLTYAAIAEDLGYADESGARAAVRRALARIAEPEVDTWRELETSRILDLICRLYDELNREHAIVQFGKVVLGADKKPLHDPGAVVTIVREIRQLSAELSRLRGLYAPQRLVVEEVPTELVMAEAERIIAQADAIEGHLREMGVLGPGEWIDVDAEGGPAMS